MTVNLDYYKHLRFARITAGRAGLTLRIVDDAVTGRTNGQFIEMPPIRPEWPTDGSAMAIWMGLLCHECLHNEGTNMDDITVLQEQDINLSGVWGQIHNMLVDHNIEFKGQKEEYIGRNRWLRLLHNYFSTAYPPPKPRNELEAKLVAVHKLTQFSRGSWQNINYSEDSYNFNEITEQYNKIKHLLPELQVARAGGQDNIDFTDKIIKLLEISEDEQDKQANSSGQGQGEGSGEGKAAQAKGKGEGDEQAKAAAQAAVMRYKDLNFDPHDPDGESGSPLEIVYTDSDYDPHNTYIMGERKELTSRNSGVDRLSHGLTDTLSRKVAKVLRARSQTVWAGGKKRGRLKARNIARLACGQDTIFKQKHTKMDLKSTAVSILVDASGSMSGNKAKQASIASLMLNDCLNKLHVSHEIACFTTGGGSSVIHEIVKPFSNKISKTVLAERLDRCYQSACCNADGENILYAADNLRRHKSKRKILIVLSDGQPAASPQQGCVYSFTKDTVRAIENRGDIEIYGIGICSDAVSNIYKRYKVINNPNQLEQALLETVQDTIINFN